MEWLRSPIIYLEKYTAIKKLRELANEYFNAKSCLYHYLNMAEGNYRTYLKTDEVRIKKYFYLLRPILACSWIEERNTMAPMEFDKLVESQVNDENVKAEIYSLLKRKKEGEELGIEPKIKLLNKFIDEKIQYFNNYLKKFNVDVLINTEKLNIIFRETLGEVDG
jgi:predicted nucleotidyltransferase